MWYTNGTTFAYAGVKALLTMANGPKEFSTTVNKVLFPEDLRCSMGGASFTNCNGCGCVVSLANE